MSDLIYGPDGNPISGQTTEPAPKPETPAPKETDEVKPAVPYGAGQQSFTSIPSPDPSDYTPKERTLMDLLAFCCGLVGIFMIGTSGYWGLVLMFGAGLAAVLFGILTKHNNGYRSLLGTIGLVLGIISVVVAVLTIASMMYFLTHQQEMKEAMELYQRLYEQITGQPFPMESVESLFS